MAAKYYLRIPGIDGGSTDGAHAGWIDIESYRGGEESLETKQNQGSPSGGESGKVIRADHHFTKRMDQATKKLMEAAMSGRRFPKVTLEAVRQSKGGGKGRQQKVIEYVFEDALITKYSLDPSADVTPEAFTLGVEKVTCNPS